MRTMIRYKANVTPTWSLLDVRRDFIYSSFVRANFSIFNGINMNGTKTIYNGRRIALIKPLNFDDYLIDDYILKGLFRISTNLCKNEFIYKNYMKID